MYFKALYIYDRLFLFHDSVVSDSLRSITLMYPSKKTLTYNRNSTISSAIFSQPAVVKPEFFLASLSNLESTITLLNVSSGTSQF